MAKTPTDKIEETSATPQGSVVPTAAAARFTFRDLLYTSRVLITPKTERSLFVSKTQVDVAADDAEAIAYLTDHKEFVPKE
jgi:hypothetical protein